MNYTPKALTKADSLVGTKCKIYYPWGQRYIHRVVRKDMDGYYVNYKGEKKSLRIALNDYGGMVCFEMLHGRR